MRNSLLAVLLLFCSLSVFAQADRSDVRAGNRKYRHRQYKEAEIDYRKALDKDSTSLTARYDLASSLYSRSAGRRRRAPASAPASGRASGS